MQDPSITSFLNGRRDDYLKKNLKTILSEEDKLAIEQEAIIKFSLAEWLPAASVRAKQLSLVSHPAKFSHSGAKATAVIATEVAASNDGYVRAGNIPNTLLDVVGNAAALDVYKFLMLVLQDGQTILQHLEGNTSVIKEQFSIPSKAYDEICAEFLQIKPTDSELSKTSGLLKQVYFPVNESEYHLLSILTPSSAIYKLKDKINDIRFSEEAKDAREAKKENQFHDTGLTQIMGLAGIGYGGTKPQNISNINSQNGGVSLLLSSTPPSLQKRVVQPPKENFFDIKQQWLKPFEKQFLSFHNLLDNDRNNRHIRQKRDQLIELVFLMVADNMQRLRHDLPANWSDSDHYQQLPQWQKVWLDSAYDKLRLTKTEYLEKALNEFSIWFIAAYYKLIKNSMEGISDIDKQHVKKQVTIVKEAFQ